LKIIEFCDPSKLQNCSRHFDYNDSNQCYINTVVGNVVLVELYW